MATVAHLEAILSANTAPFDAAMTHSEGRMGGAQKAMLGASLAIAGGIAYMGVKAVSAAADFEAGLNSMQAVSGATGEEMKKISKLAIQLGNDAKLPGTSAKDAAEAMTELSKSGMTIDQTMKAVRSTLVLSAAAQISNARAAEITSNALNAFGLNASKTGKVVDMLANAANASSVEIEDVADSMKMAGAIFSGMQGPAVGAEQALKDLTIATALLGNAGIKGSDAGTSLKQMLLSLAAPADKTKTTMRDLFLATGSGAEGMALFKTSIHGVTKKIRDEASGALEELQGGVRGGGDIAYDAAGKMRPLKDIVGQVTEATKNMTQEERNYIVGKIFGADASRAVLVLMRQQAEGWDNMSDKIGKAGSAQALADAKMKGFKGSVDAFKSTLDTLAITFGLVLLPVVTAIMGKFTSMVNLMAEHRDITMIVIGVLGTLAVTYLAVVIAMKAYAAAMVLGAAVTKTVTAAQLLLNVALAANPIGLVIIGLVALGVALVVAWKKSETFRDIVIGAWEAIKSGVEPVVQFFTTTVPNAFQSVINWVTQNWPKIALLLAGPFAPLIALGTNAFGLRDIMGNALTGAGNKITEMAGAIAGWGTSIGNWIKNATVTAITGIGNAVWGIINNIWERIVEMTGTVKGWGTSVGTWVKDAVVAAVVGIGSAVWNVVNNIWSVISEAAGTVQGWGSSVGGWYKAAVIGAIVGVGAGAWGIINNIWEFVSERADAVKGWGTSIGTWVKNAVVAGLTGLGTAIWNAIKSAWNWALDKVKDLPGIGKLIGDPKDPNFNPFTGAAGAVVGATGGINLDGANPEMMPFAQAAQAFGLGVSSGLRPGAITANGTLSDHARGKALDVSNTYRGDPDGTPEMASFFQSLIGNSSVKQAFYDPLGSLFGGLRSGYQEGDHTDHVHVATYDKGGWLAPFSKTLAINRTPYWEPVGPPGRGAGGGRGDVYVTVNGWVADERSLARKLLGVLQDLDQSGTGGRVLNSTPRLT